AYVTRVSDTAASSASALPADALQRIDALASSWGLTQIMGYHCIEAVGEELPGISPAHMDIVSKPLQEPDFALAMTVRMLRAFCKEWHLPTASTAAVEG